MVFEFGPGSGKTERGPLIVPRRAADVSVRDRECHAGPNQVGAFAELIVRWIAALVPFRRVAAPGLFIGGLGRNIVPTGGNISVGLYSSTAPPVMWAA